MHFTVKQLQRIYNMDFEEFIEILYIPDSEYSMGKFRRMQNNFAAWLFELSSDKLEMLSALKPCKTCELKLSGYCVHCVHGRARDFYKEEKQVENKK